MVIVADYDCDGATACAVGIRALRAFGADVHYLVPDRSIRLRPPRPSSRLAARLEPDVHHRRQRHRQRRGSPPRASTASPPSSPTTTCPATKLPEADVIVNPNQPGCDFPSKALAGVGAMFYTMLALRRNCASRRLPGNKEPNLAESSSTWSPSAPSPTWSSSTATTASWSRKASRMRAGRLQPGIRALFRSPGATGARQHHGPRLFMIGPPQRRRATRPT